MNRSATILMTVAVALGGLFALTQASSALSTMPGMDAACFASCLDQATHDAAAPSAIAFTVVLAAIAAVWSFAAPSLASRFETSAVVHGGHRRRGPLQQRRE